MQKDERTLSSIVGGESPYRSMYNLDAAPVKRGFGSHLPKYHLPQYLMHEAI